jgi:hypothetical protein
MKPTKKKSEAKEKIKEDAGGRVPGLSENTANSNRVSSKPEQKSLALSRICYKKSSIGESVRRFFSITEVNPTLMVEADVAGKILTMNGATR